MHRDGLASGRTDWRYLAALGMNTIAVSGSYSRADELKLLAQRTLVQITYSAELVGCRAGAALGIFRIPTPSGSHFDIFETKVWYVNLPVVRTKFQDVPFLR